MGNLFRFQEKRATARPLKRMDRYEIKIVVYNFVEVSDVDASYVPTDAQSDTKRRQFTVTGLFPYNNYTFRINAKNSFPMPGFFSIPSSTYFFT